MRATNKKKKIDVLKSLKFRLSCGVNEVTVELQLRYS
jgi:hypothetical protein